MTESGGLAMLFHDALQNNPIRYPMTPPAQPPEQMIETETPLWQFSVSLWKDSQAANAALELQAAGWIVSRLLVAAFLAREGSIWDGRGPDEIERWHQDVTRSLRALRITLPKGRADLAALRAQVARAELEAERLELGWWFHWLQQNPLPGIPAQHPMRSLAENLVAAGGGLSPQTLPALRDFSQRLIQPKERESFSLELQAALDQADRRP